MTEDVYVWILIATLVVVGLVVVLFVRHYESPAEKQAPRDRDAKCLYQQNIRYTNAAFDHYYRTRHDCYTLARLASTDKARIHCIQQCVEMGQAYLLHYPSDEAVVKEFLDTDKYILNGLIDKSRGNGGNDNE